MKKKFSDEDVKWYHKVGMVAYLIVTSPWWIIKGLIKLSKTTM